MDVATECRKDGPTRVLATFNEPVQGSGLGGTPQTTDVTVVDTAGSAITISAVTLAGNVLTIDMSGVAEPTRATIRFPGITDLSGNVCVSSICLGVIYGDVNGDGVNRLADLVYIRDHANQITNATNCRGDVNLNGSLRLDDMVIVRDHMNEKVPPPPCP